jgi:hypothetical protein
MVHKEWKEPTLAKSMRDGNVYGNNERRFLAYHVYATMFYIKVTQRPTNVSASQIVWPMLSKGSGQIHLVKNAQGLFVVAGVGCTQSSCKFNHPGNTPTSAVARANCHLREFKYRTSPKEAIEIEDDE